MLTEYRALSNIAIRPRVTLPMLWSCKCRETKPIRTRRLPARRGPGVQWGAT